MTAHNFAAALICWCLLSAIVAAAWACWREAGKRHAPDPFDTITAWRDDIGRDLRAMSTYEASAVLGLQPFFRDWDALVEKERQS